MPFAVLPVRLGILKTAGRRPRGLTIYRASHPVADIMTRFDNGRLQIAFSCAGRDYEAVQDMPFSDGFRSRKSIGSKYREAAAVPRVCSENDPRCGRVTWSDVRKMPEVLGERP